MTTGTFCPSGIKIEDIRKGDYLKVVFVVPPFANLPTTYHGFKERLWIRFERILNADEGVLLGVLDQMTLFEIENCPRIGQEIAFRIENVIAKFNPEESL